MDTSFFKENPFTTEETCTPKPRYGETFYPLSTAREWDNESSTYHYRARYYNQNAGIFTQRDPIGNRGGLNLYYYAKNNPIRYTDPKGLCCSDNNFSLNIQVFSSHWTAGNYDFHNLIMLPNNCISLFPPNALNVVALLGPCPLGEKLTAILAVGPIDAWTANSLANDANNAARDSGLPGAHNGQRDAFRHCFWSCRMTQEIGADQAKDIGDIHEDCNPNPADELAMDQHNNAAGRAYGSKPGTDCNSACLSGVNDGTLQNSVGGTPGQGYD